MDRQDFPRTAGNGRRRFLGGVLGSATAAALPFAPTAGLAAATHGPFDAQPLADDLWLVSGAACNIVAGRGPDGALLVDGGQRQESAALLRFVLERTRAPRVSLLFNTHWHPEQTGSNETVGTSGARIVAHEYTRLWLGRPIQVDWLPKPYGPLPPAARPNKTTYTTGSLTSGNRRIEYGWLGQAHTDGDLYIHFPDDRLLVAGGVVSNAGWPLLDYRTGGWIGGLVGGYDKLLELAGPDTRIVPANGPLLTRADLQSQRTMYFTIYDRLVKLLMKGLGPEEAVAQEPAREYAQQWGDPGAFITDAFRSMWGHFAADA